MSKVLVNESSLSSIGNAIREKNGETTKYKPSEMGEAILSLSVGSGDTIPDEAFINYVPDNSYRFYNNAYNWFINGYKDRLNGLTLASHMFGGSHLLKTTPSLKIYGSSIDYAFLNCQNITELDISAEYSQLYFQNYNGIAMNNLFENCQRLRTVPYDMFGDVEPSTYSSDYRDSMFMGCYSLRELPNLLPANAPTIQAHKCLYNYLANACYTLNKIENLPVVTGTYTSNTFNGTVTSCYRIKDFTFNKNNDGTPITANWKNQVIDLTNNLGWSNGDVERINGYNSGIVGNRVTNDANYDEYKNNEDWWTSDYRYSRYNKISAVNTINSLPDTSAYISANGGTNTIKFKGDAGQYTDGGAINTLTAEELAVATSRGWTVSLV